MTVLLIKCLLYFSVHLTDNYSIHVIELPSESGRRYVACAEVSALLWDEDVLREKVDALFESFICFQLSHT